MNDDDRELQETEILALQSIYDDQAVFTTSQTEQGFLTGVFNAMLKFHGKITLVNNNDSSSFQVEHLPPVCLQFSLPSNYPSKEPPDFTLKCIWLSHDQLSSICHELDQLWSSGSEVLYMWSSFLSHDLPSFIQLDSTLAITLPLCNHCDKLDSRVVLNLIDQPLADLLQFNDIAKENQFNQSFHECGVCFTDHYGSNCLTFLGCQHVFCRPCITGYFQVQIRDGEVRNLNCLAEKCPSKAVPTQVKQLVDTALYERYERLLLQSSLDMMTDVVKCPRPTCETHVVLDVEAAMGHCPRCDLVFCSRCHMTYHGVQRCRLKTEDMKKLIAAHRAGELDGTFLENMKKRYGTRTIMRLLEECQSMLWVESNSKPCPRCSSPIEKADGCNKVICTKCGSPMCWLCGSLLPKDAPYRHFNLPDSPCYNKLFEGMDMS